MVVIWGSSLYGKVDEVPGLGYVATQFGHLYYFPLIPMGSYVVLDEHNGVGGSEWSGTSIGFSGKSLLIAYLRAALLVAFLVAGFAIFMASAKMIPLVVCGVAGLLGFATYKIPAISTADYARARRMADQLGMTEEGRILIDLQYGRVRPEKAEARLTEIAHQRAAKQAIREMEREAKRHERKQEREAKKAERAKKQSSPENKRLRAKAPQRRKRSVARR